MAEQNRTANAINNEITRLKYEQSDFKRTIEHLLLETIDIAVSLEGERMSKELPCSESEIERLEALADSLEDSAKSLLIAEMESTALTGILESFKRVRK